MAEEIAAQRNEGMSASRTFRRSTGTVFEDKLLRLKGSTATASAPRPGRAMCLSVAIPS